MECIKFAKIDFIKSLPQVKIMPLFLVIALIMGAKIEGVMFPVIYVAFGALIMVTLPYITEAMSEQGFFALLPARVGSRTRGRYLYGVLYLLIACIVGALIAYVTALFNKEDLSHFFLYSIITFSIVIVVNDIQFIIFSLLKVKNVQVLSVIRMVIPFVLFFGANGIMEEVGSNPDAMMAWMVQWLDRIQNNLAGTALITLGVSILITILFCEICVLKEKQSS